MKPLVLHSSSISLWLKNKLKIFPSKKIHEKGGPALRWVIYEPSTLLHQEVENGSRLQGLINYLATVEEHSKIFQMCWAKSKGSKQFQKDSNLGPHDYEH